MKSVLLCLVLVVALDTCVATNGCPNGKGVCVERKYCPEHESKKSSLHTCRMESRKHGVCCGVSSITLGNNCTFRNKDFGKCVPESSCRPLYRYNIWGNMSVNVWKMSANKCHAASAKNYYCCPASHVTKLDPMELLPAEHDEENDIGVETRYKSTRSQMVVKNAFSSCQTASKSDGHYVPFGMCDHYRKELHQLSRELSNWISETMDSTSICCPDSALPNSFSLIAHKKAHKLGLHNCGPVPTEYKLLKGGRAGLGQYPWMANLMYMVGRKRKTLCSGSLIHPRFVLTAAHCTKTDYSMTAVRLGDYDLSTPKDFEDGELADPYKEYGIDKCIPHLNHNRGRSYDIALIRLKTEVVLQLGHIYPVCLPLTPALLMLKSKHLTITGWGETAIGVTSDVLLKADVVVDERSNFTECKQASTFCARGSEMEGNCRGDSGGPLQTTVPYKNTYRTVLFGIVSAGARKCTVEDKTPGVSVLVGYHIHWILDNMDI